MLQRSPRDQRDELIEELREEITQLRRIAFGQDLLFPAQWRLSQTETILMQCLMSQRCVNFDTFEPAVLVIRHDFSAEPKTLDVFISKLRAKLAPFGVGIVTLNRSGWCLSGDTKARIRAIMEQPDSFPSIGPPVPRPSAKSLILEVLDQVRAAGAAGVTIQRLAAAHPESAPSGLSTILKKAMDRGLPLRREMVGYSPQHGYRWFWTREDDQ